MCCLPDWPSCSVAAALQEKVKRIIQGFIRGGGGDGGLPPLSKIPPPLAIMNQWTVPLEWNGGMEYWNYPYSPCYFFPEAVLGVCNGSESLRV